MMCFCAQRLLLLVAHRGGFLRSRHTNICALNGVRFLKNVLHLWGLFGRWEKTEQSVRPRRDRAPPIEFCARESSVCVCCWSCSALGHLSSRLAAAPRTKKTKSTSERQARFSQPETIITVTRVFLCDRISRSRAGVSFNYTLYSQSACICLHELQVERDNPRTLVNGSECISVFGVQIDLTPWNGPRSIGRCVITAAVFCGTNRPTNLEIWLSCIISAFGNDLLYRQVRCVITGRWHCCRFYWTFVRNFSEKIFEIWRFRAA